MVVRKTSACGFVKFEALKMTNWLANVCLGNEKLGAQVAIEDRIIVEDGQFVDTCKYKVLGYFVAQGSHANEQNIGISKSVVALEPLLGLGVFSYLV